MSGRTENIRFNVYLNDKQAGNTMSSLYSESRKLKAELKYLTIGSKEWIDKMQQVQRVEGSLKKVRSEINQTNKGFSGMANSVNKYFTMVTAGIATLTGVVYGIKEWIKGNVGLSDSLANVQKTTGMARKEVRELYTSFRTLNTRTARSELLAYAEEAGRLGKKSKKDVMDFVEVANQIGVALGDDLGGNTAEATKEVGKLTEIYRIGTKYGVDFKKAMLMVGSSINEVSANSQAQASYLIDFMKRMGGISGQAKISAQEVIGLAAALDQLGQPTELAATAVNKVVLNMFKDTAEYARIAGMSVEDFNALLQKDSNEAFLKFLEGLNGNNEGLSVMAGKLDGLGLDGARAVQVLASLAGNTKLVREQQDLANTSLEKGTSLTNEYLVKNNNLAGNWEKIGQRVNSLFINSDMNKAMEKTVALFAKLIEIPVSETMEKERMQVNMLTIELTNSNTTADRRNEIYKELQQLSPEVVKGIDAENISIQTLRGNLAKYNEEMVKKIALQTAGEKYAETEQAYGEAQGERLIKESNLMREMQTIQQEAMRFDKVRAGIMEDILISNTDILEKQKLIQMYGELINKEQGMNMIELNSAGNAAYYLVSAKEKELELQIENNKQLDLFNRMQESLGITPGAEPPPITTTTTTTTGGTKGGNTTSQDAILAKAIDLTEKINSLTREHELAQMESNKREIAGIQDKYGKLILEAAGYNDKVAELVALRDEEIAMKEAEQDAKLLEQKQAAMEAIQQYTFTSEQEELASAQAQYDNLIMLAGQFGLDEVAITETYEAQMAAIKQKYLDQNVRATAESQKRNLQTQMQAATASLALTANIFGSAAALMDEHTQGYKNMMVAQAIFNTLGSAVAAFQAMASIPVVGPALGAVAAAAALVFGFAQVSQMKSTTYAKGGIAQGASHREGGISMIDSKTGNKVGEMEGGEPYLILSNDTYKNNKTLVDELLDSSMNRGGASVQWMKPGYYPSADISGAVDNIRTMRYASGAVTNQNNTYNQYQQSQQSDSGLQRLMSEMLDEFRNFKYVKAVIDQDNTLELKKAMKDIDAIETKSGMA